MLEEGEGPIATNNNPDLRARMHIMPNSSWIVMLFRSWSDDCGKRLEAEVGKEEATSGEVVEGKGW